MTSPSSNTAEKKEKSGGLIRALVLLAAITCIIFVMVALVISQKNPYIDATLKQNGSEIRGAQLFRINCAGCHGLNGRGLVGPDLENITHRRRDSTIIKQKYSGKTPPMPSFQMDTQAMADLVSFLHALD